MFMITVVRSVVNIKRSVLTYFVANMFYFVGLLYFYFRFVAMANSKHKKNIPPITVNGMYIKLLLFLTWYRDIYHLQRNHLPILIAEIVIVFQYQVHECILRRLADIDAFQSGRPAEQNGHPETLFVY